MMKNKDSIIYGLMILCIVLISSCTDNKSNKSKEKIVSVKIEEVHADNVSLNSYIGTSEENISADISFLVSGNIREINVRESEKVKKGQKLASLDITNLNNSNNAAEAAYKQAKDAYDRMKKLYDNGSLPEIKFIEIKTKLEQAQSAYAITKKNLEEGTLYAPFDGIISKCMISTGENVLPGKPVFRLISVDDIKIRFSVPEKEITDIRINDTASVSVQAFDNEIFEGLIIEKGLTTSSLNPLYDIKLLVRNSEGRILPGMTCRVNLKNNDKNSNITIPARAVMTGSSGERFVWLLKNGKANAVNIETGAFTQNGIIIKSGIKEGDKIVTEGYQKISEGMNIAER